MIPWWALLAAGVLLAIAVVVLGGCVSAATPMAIHRARLEAACYSADGEPRTDLPACQQLACYQRYEDYHEVWE